MEEKNTKSKKRIVYSVILAACALLLIAGIVLTVYFVTEGTKQLVDVPPIEDDTPGEDDPIPPPGDIEDPGKDDPVGGEDTVKFAAPIDCEEFSVEYSSIYENKTTGWWYRHKAVDFASAAGTEVRSMADGTVESVSVSRELGNLITVDHGGGLKTYYRFVEPVDGLKAGDKVTKGQKIGEVAEAYGSEAKDGEHLHLEITLGEDFVDPTDYLKPIFDEK